MYICLTQVKRTNTQERNDIVFESFFRSLVEQRETNRSRVTILFYCKQIFEIKKKQQLSLHLTFFTSMESE